MKLLKQCIRYGQQVFDAPAGPVSDPAVNPVLLALPEVVNHAVELWWYSVPLRVSSLSELSALQTGYQGPGWDPTWMVFASAGGDPIFLDSGDGSVGTAVHGVGSWTKIPLAPGMAEWVEAMSAWMDLSFGSYGGRPMSDGELADGFETQLLKVLTPIVGPLARNWMPD